MSSIVTEQGILHYETIGRGQPVILLHGWINSWNVWRETMIALSQQGNFRVYALDFWGFGESAKSRSDAFKIDSYVSMVNEFMESLGMVAVPLAGHSMGGTVALTMALAHPERVKSVAVVGSPIVGRTLNIFLKLAGYGWIARLSWRVPGILPSIMWMLLSGDSEKVRSMISRDVQKTTLESFFRSIGDLRTKDLRQEVGSLTIPVYGIYGRKDNIVSPRNAGILARRLPSAQITMMDDSRHFPMADEPEKMVRILREFLSPA